MKTRYLFLILLLCIASLCPAQETMHYFAANDPHIQYYGRVDFTRPAIPRFWQPGVYIVTRYSGTHCEVIVNDEVLWGNKHNYLEIVVDGKPVRLQTHSKTDTIVVARNLSPGLHDLVICKNTEANIGYIELVGIRCSKLAMPAPKPLRKLEFIGNSITCGTGSDISKVPCGKGVWEDQHNAYFSYGAVTARALNAQYQLSAVSGIGLMHSCCNLGIIMPVVFDKISMRNDSILWNFHGYQPDLVTVCLGQNDGIQDSSAFCRNYISFVHQLRKYYPRARIICLTSPMADAKLVSFMKKTLTAIREALRHEGDLKVFTYFFSRQYHAGCDGHPNLTEHQLIAAELTGYIKKITKW